MNLHHRLLALSDRINGLVERLLLVIGVAFSIILFAQGSSSSLSASPCGCSGDAPRA